MRATSVNFHVTAQSKQSSIGRKFTQTGHPADVHTYVYTMQCVIKRLYAFLDLKIN
jgi:hypothetical protein